MKKVLNKLFPREKWWNFTLIGVIFLVVLHVFSFFWHSHLVHRYDELYNQATKEGTLIDMPADFQKAHSASQARNIFTRPDVLARESDILQSGIRSLEKQYNAAIDHFHGIIEHDIASLRDVAQASQEYIFPQREAIASLADTYESELNSGKYVRVEDIRKLSIMSDDATKKAQTEFDLTKRVLILEDTLALKHEMAFLDSYYRFVR